MDPKIKKILNEECDRVDIEYNQGEEIWKLLGQFIKENMKKGDIEDFSTFKNIYIRGLGTFYTNSRILHGFKKKRDNIRAYKEKQKQKDNEFSE
jgi:hypothetical protein